MAKKKVSAAPAAAAAGRKLPARDLAPEGPIEQLKALNIVLVKETAELREQINQLRTELAALAADHDVEGIERDVFGLVLSFHLAEAAARGAAERAAATETEWTLQKKAESAIGELNAAQMRLNALARENVGLMRSLGRVVEERDLSRSDLEEKRKEITNLEERLLSSEQALDRMSTVREVTDAERGKLGEEGKRREEMLQSVMHEKVLMESGLKEKKDLMEELIREMKDVNSRKETDMELLNTETKAKFSALEEQCRNLKEIRSQLENDFSDLKFSLDEQKKVELIAIYEEMKKRSERVEGDFKRTLTDFDVKEEKMNMEINELKGNLTKMAAEKDLYDQTRAKYEIEISNLNTKLFNLDSTRKRLVNAYYSCSKESAIKEAKCASVQSELNRKEDEAVALRLQVKELTESKQNFKLNFDQLQIELNCLTTENERTRKHLNILTVEKASLEKQLDASHHGLHDIEKKLKASEMAYGRVFTILKKTTAEVVGQERTQENCISRETGVEVENDEAVQLLMDNLEAIKLAIKSKDSKIKVMKQELELLQLLVIDAQKNKGGIWKWLYPATTTIIAAVSLAHAVRAR